MHAKNAYRYFSIAFLFIFSTCAYAEAQWCRVELIVFAQNGKSSEAFDQDASRIEWPGDLRELAETPLPLADLKQLPQAYVPLPSADWTLTAAYQTLQLQGGYRPLLHGAWVQPLAIGQAAAALHVRAAGAAGDREIVSGFIRVESADALYLSADLEYAPGAQDDGGIIYRLHERRRFGLDEVHYLDHPKFGLIVRVSALQ
jgi:hypothetical protein